MVVHLYFLRQTDARVLYVEQAITCRFVQPEHELPESGSCSPSRWVRKKIIGQPIMADRFVVHGDSGHKSLL
ncbi:hypothetical protein [Streptomyces sp. NPDC040750]|uniref:hypothetical protein n=1 Tax=Streptomyces sp. NPDC040750 TaxID=3154491 RepID=UPI0033C662C8